MEEFHLVLTDRFALTLLNRRQLRAEHFDTLTGGVGRRLSLGAEIEDVGRNRLLERFQLLERENADLRGQFA